ncbi:MAG: hypothetical protein HOP08_06875 [Cyclobacteriaceae bacterium]|nr:hypothetical protein [Cyclobacteriaceae bacterium]
MGEELLKAVPVYLLSMLKFIFGPITGFGAKLHIITTVLVTIGGMMTSVVAVTYFGEWIKTRVIEKMKKWSWVKAAKSFLRKIGIWFKLNVYRKIFKRKRKAKAKDYSEFWKKYGLTGIAFFTPLFLTPIGGTILALSSGYTKEKILFYMLISAVSWALIFSSIIYFVGAEVIPDFITP